MTALVASSLAICSYVNDHPMAPEIWLGGLIMALGGFLSLSDRRLRVGAPARKKLARKKPAGAVA